MHRWGRVLHHGDAHAAQHFEVYCRPEQHAGVTLLPHVRRKEEMCNYTTKAPERERGKRIRDAHCAPTRLLCSNIHIGTAQQAATMEARNVNHRPSSHVYEANGGGRNLERWVFL